MILEVHGGGEGGGVVLLHQFNSTPQMFIECLLCARDPVGKEVTMLPASQHNRRAETIDLTHRVWSRAPLSVPGSFS